jgi:hypothetical protein
MPLADVDEIEDDSSEFEHQHKRDFAGNNDDLTCSPDIGNILIAIFYWFQSFIFNGKLPVEQIWQTAAKVDKI